MSHTIHELLDQNGNYDINRGYKYIFKENADEALKVIRKSLDYVKNSQCIQSKRSSYLVDSHACKFDEVAYRDKKNGSCFRREEWICKRCKGESFNFIGKIVDYQVPLKHKHSQECSGLGKVDLLSQNGSVAYLLEVKTRGNTEAPLRAIMEIYTYWKQLGGNECRNFLDHSALCNATVLKKAIVLFEGSRMHKKLMESGDELGALMRELEVECFFAKSTTDGNDFIEDIIEYKL